MISLIITLLTTGLFTIWDSILIKKGKQIDHWLETFIHFGIVFIVGSLMIPTIKGFLLTIISFILGRAGTYDYLLNICRGLPLNYTSTQTGSITDKLEQKTKIGEIALRKFFLLSLIIYIVCLLIFN